ncbi:unnamed protein product [Amoebophrya sp. A25]|nr:unnamed protein product [Amoebophrya sp. A25]|eukprot:GSA25T00011748001.1
MAPPPVQHPPPPPLQHPPPPPEGCSSPPASPKGCPIHPASSERLTKSTSCDTQTRIWCALQGQMGAAQHAADSAKEEAQVASHEPSSPEDISAALKKIGPLVKKAEECLQNVEQMGCENITGNAKITIKAWIADAKIMITNRIAEVKGAQKHLKSLQP